MAVLTDGLMRVSLTDSIAESTILIMGNRSEHQNCQKTETWATEFVRPVQIG